MQIRPHPSADAVEAFSPELGELGDRYAAVTLAGDTDFDSEIFLATRALLEGQDLAVAEAMITPTHPGTAEARRLLCAAWLRHLAN